VYEILELMIEPDRLRLMYNFCPILLSIIEAGGSMATYRNNVFYPLKSHATYGKYACHDQRKTIPGCSYGLPFLSIAI